MPQRLPFAKPARAFPPNACRGERCGVWGRTAPINPVRLTHSIRRGPTKLSGFLHVQAPTTLTRRIERALERYPELEADFPEKDFAEWMDAYWARDIQEMFRLEKRPAFLGLFELLLAQSGGLCELNSFTSRCGASRQTLANYLGVLEATGAVHVVRPFSKNPQREIVAMPKVFGFDTGFVCYARGWRDVRREDLGGLWEHLVLDELRTRFSPSEVFYWRDKQKHELDFVLARRGCPPIAIECKWKLAGAGETHFPSFHALYPDARLMVVATDAGAPRAARKDGRIETGLGHLAQAVEEILNPDSGI